MNKRILRSMNLLVVFMVAVFAVLGLLVSRQFGTRVKEGLPQRYFLSQSTALSRLAGATSTFNLLAFNKKTLQYRSQCEQPLNSRLFLEEFFISYAAVFARS